MQARVATIHERVGIAELQRRSATYAGSPTARAVHVNGKPAWVEIDDPEEARNFLENGHIEHPDLAGTPVFIGGPHRITTVEQLARAIFDVEMHDEAMVKAELTCGFYAPTGDRRKRGHVDPQAALLGVLDIMWEKTEPGVRADCELRAEEYVYAMRRSR